MLRLVFLFYVFKAELWSYPFRNGRMKYRGEESWNEFKHSIWLTATWQSGAGGRIFHLFIKITLHKIDYLLQYVSEKKILRLSLNANTSSSSQGINDKKFEWDGPKLMQRINHYVYRCKCKVGVCLWRDIILANTDIKENMGKYSDHYWIFPW